MCNRQSSEEVACGITHSFLSLDPSLRHIHRTVKSAFAVLPPHPRILFTNDIPPRSPTTALIDDAVGRLAPGISRLSTTCLRFFSRGQRKRRRRRSREDKRNPACPFLIPFWCCVQARRNSLREGGRRNQEEGGGPSRASSRVEKKKSNCQSGPLARLHVRGRLWTERK